MTLHNVREAIAVSDSDITASSFINVNLAKAVFDDVNLHQARFTNVNLSGTTLDDINLSNVSITNANIAGMRINGIAIAELLEGRRPQDGGGAT